MAAVDDPANPYPARFKQFLARSAVVARQCIEVEGNNAPISDAARERALNILSYTLQEVEAWAATRDLLLTMAPKMEMAGYRTDWIQYLQQGLAQSQRWEDRPAEAALHFHGGYLYRLIGNYAQARMWLAASGALYAALGETQSQARAVNQLAYLAWQQHQYNEAEQLAQEALSMVEDISLEKAVSLSALGLVANDRSRYAEAEKYHHAALRIRTHHLAEKEMAWSLQNLGLALRDQGKIGMAIEHFKQALTLLDRVYDPAHKAIIQMNLGGAYHARGQDEQALEIFLVAEKGLRQVSDDFNLAKLLTIKGLCYLTLHQGHLAEQAFRTSSDLFQQLNDLSWYLNAYDGLGISYLEQEQYDQALAIFEAVAAQLPEIEGTPAYKYLTATIQIQIKQAKAKQVERGKSVYFPPQNQD